MVVERIAPTVARCHGNDATAESFAAGAGPAAAADGGNPTAASADAAATAASADATGAAGTERQSQQEQLNVRGFDNIETFSGGQDQWQILSWKIKTAVPEMYGVLAEPLNAAETGGERDVGEILKDDEPVDAHREECIKASRELHSVMARYTKSEALTIVRTVTELEKVAAWRMPHENCRRTLGRLFRFQRECMYPKPVKDLSQVRLAVMQKEKKRSGKP